MSCFKEWLSIKNLVKFQECKNPNLTSKRLLLSCNKKINWVKMFLKGNSWSRRPIRIKPFLSFDQILIFEAVIKAISWWWSNPLRLFAHKVSITPCVLTLICLISIFMYLGPKHYILTNHLSGHHMMRWILICNFTKNVKSLKFK